MASPRQCKACNQGKPLTEFGKASTHLGGDGRMRICNACRAARKVAKNCEPPAAADPDHPGPKITAGPSIGYAAQLRDTDVVLWQNSDQGEQTIWLSRYEARELAAFINKLDAQPEAT